jgi:hypothetical protein
LTRWLPGWAEAALAWLVQPAVLGAIAIGSAALFVGSAVGVPWVVCRMPPDYFSRRERDRLGLEPSARSRWLVLVRVAKNGMGVVLLLAGTAMLVLPGQGLLTIIVSLFLLDFPGKRRLQRRIVAAPRVLGALNALRRRAGRPPLERAALTRDRKVQ